MENLKNLKKTYTVALPVEIASLIDRDAKEQERTVRHIIQKILTEYYSKELNKGDSK